MSSPPRTALLRAPALLLAAYLVLATGFVGYRAGDKTADLWRLEDLRTDFDVFYAAARVMGSEFRGRLYQVKARAQAPPEYDVALGNYFNPPLFAAVYAPFTLLDLATARRALVVVATILALGIVALARAWDRRPAFLAAALLAVASFWPLYETMRFGHLSLIYALVAGLALLALESRRMGTGGALVALLALKPSIAVAPAGLVLWLGHRRGIAALALSGALFVLLPFFFLGLGAVVDYQALLANSRADGFSRYGGVTGGAVYMFNWNGFIARLFLIDPDPFIVFPLYMATAMLMVRVWTKGDLRASWLAATLATLLAMPHMLWYDWVLLLPAGLAYAAARPGATAIALLALVHLAANVSTMQMVDQALETRAYFVATPAAFLLLAYLAFGREAGEWIARSWKGSAASHTSRASAAVDAQKTTLLPGATRMMASDQSFTPK